jgi:hypothetical protein
MILAPGAPHRGQTTPDDGRLAILLVSYIGLDAGNPKTVQKPLNMSQIRVWMP